jgi:hypothetical protein
VSISSRSGFSIVSSIELSFVVLYDYPMTDEKKSPEKDQKPDSIKILNIPKETGGRGGLEPTRYDDWEIKGKCVDF